MKASLWLCALFVAIAASSGTAHAQAGDRALLFSGENGGGSAGGYAGLTNALVGAGAAGVDTNTTTLSGASLTNYRLVFVLANSGLSAGSITTLQSFYVNGGTIVAMAEGAGYRDASGPLNSLSSTLGLGNMFTSTSFDALCEKIANASGAHVLNTGAPTLRYAYGSNVVGGTLVYRGVSMDLVRVNGRFVAVGDMNAITEDCSASNASNLAFYANLWKFSAPCGNGVLQGNEQCDDNNTNDNDACTNACKTAACGDGIVRTGVEQCDDGNAINTDSCVGGCLTAKCGDGFVQAGTEMCDDGNQVNTDTCLTTCKPASCGDGFVQDGVEQCDDANLLSGDDCLPNCMSATCGDGAVHTGSELCDDGNQIDGDNCRNNCSPASCGDGVVSPGTEECDGAGATATCNENCTTAKCGDGIVNTAAGEDCEPGTGDCTEDCVSPSAHDGGCCDAGGTPPALWIVLTVIALRRRRTVRARSLVIRA